MIFFLPLFFIKLNIAKFAMKEVMGEKKLNIHIAFGGIEEQSSSQAHNMYQYNFLLAMKACARLTAKSRWDIMKFQKRIFKYLLKKLTQPMAHLTTHCTMTTKQ